jgi:spore coat polysaccharide biosynthesis protein SpsF
VEVSVTNTVALIQARMSSTRFPGKVLEALNGVPMIVFMVERVRAAARLDKLVVVTSTDASDDALCAALTAHAIDFFRGELDDVLARFTRAAERFDARHVVRLTGDCPLVDPNIVDTVVATHLRDGADYTSNVDPPSYPDGLDVECFSSAVLRRAFEEASAPAEREHVTLWMRSEAAALRRSNVAGIADLSHLRLTVDYPDDLVAVRRVVERCGPKCDLFDMLRCLAASPDIVELNRHGRNEGLLKSLGSDS